jgi:hypothetical protein
LGSIIIGKVVFYYLYELGKSGLNYFFGKPNYKEPVKKILDSLSNNRKFVDDMSKMINPQKGMDSSTIDKIVKMPLVQSQISKQIGSKNSNIDKTEIENQLKTIISKSWNDLSSKVMDKVKNDLKK